MGRATCYACHRPVGHCYCADIPRVDNQTEIVILQHPRERFHPIGTARIASLGLSKVRVEVDHARALRNGDRRLELAPGCGLLYPGPASRDLATLPPTERPSQIVVIDGTWHHAHTMFRDIPGLAKLPRYRLTPPKPSQYRIRREPARDYVSTVEAIVYCLKLIEPHTPGLDELLGAFDKMIDRQIAARPKQKKGRTLNNQRPATMRRLPRALVDQFERLVVVYGEAVASDAQGWGKELIHWGARRVATGEQFERIIRPQRKLDAFLHSCIGLDERQLAAGCTPTEFDQSWQAFVGPDDVLVGWNQAILSLLHGQVRARNPELYLKAAYHNLARVAGPLDDIIEAEGLRRVLNTCSGRTGQRLANAETLLLFLHRFATAKGAA